MGRERTPLREADGESEIRSRSGPGTHLAVDLKIGFQMLKTVFAYVAGLEYVQIAVYAAAQRACLFHSASSFPENGQPFTFRRPVIMESYYEFIAAV